MCALELSIKHHLHDVALDVLAIFLREPYAPLGSSWAAIILLPYFGPFYWGLVDILDSPNIPLFPSISTCIETPPVEKLDIIRSLRRPDPKFSTGISDGLLGSGALQIHSYHTLALGNLSLPALLGELEIAFRRAVIERGCPEIFQRRVGATAYAIREAEARLGYSLPLEYKRLVQVVNGWKCKYLPVCWFSSRNNNVLCSIGAFNGFPSLARVEDISLVRLDQPIPITGENVSPSGGESPYDPEATALECIRIDIPSPISNSTVLIIRDIDLKMTRSRNQTKGNDEKPIDYVIKLSMLEGQLMERHLIRTTVWCDCTSKPLLLSLTKP